MSAHDHLAGLWAPDAAVRSDAIRAIVQAGPKHYDATVLMALAQALDHNDYEVQEWATVALRQCRNQQAVTDALWASFWSETRHSARSCMLIALGHLGQCLTPRELLTLYAERCAHPKDLILESAIRWAGRNDSRPEMLLALQSLQQREMPRAGREPRLRVTINAALLRAARDGLATGSIQKVWLKEHGFTWVLGKLRENRMERLLAEEFARRAQPTFPDLEVGKDEEPLVPGYPLSDANEAAHVQDLAEIKNVRIREQRSIVRDQRLAQEAKRRAHYRCESCGDSLPDVMQGRRYVQAHHIEPLSEAGADTAENVAVLCPGCHARIHAGALRVERSVDGVRFVGVSPDSRSTPGAQPLKVSAALHSDRGVHDRILGLFGQLTREDQGALLRELLAVAARDNEDPA